MGLFDNKNSIMGTALGVSGAFDKSRKTDTAAAFGVALGASLGSGQKWTMADSLKLGAAIGALDSMKQENSSGWSNGYSGEYEASNNEYDDMILTSEQEEQLEEAGIDTFDFECMDDEEKMEALEEAGLDPLDFDMY